MKPYTPEALKHHSCNFYQKPSYLLYRGIALPLNFSSLLDVAITIPILQLHFWIVAHSHTGE